MAWILFLFLTLFWGCSFIAIRFAVDALPPFAAASLRVLVAVIVLGGLALVRRVPLPRSRKMRIRIGLIGLINFTIPWACLFWGEKFIPPALASILNATVPIFVLLFSMILLPGEKPTWMKGAGVVLGFIGILMVFQPSLGASPSENRALFGMLAVIVMSISYALGSIASKSVVKEVDTRWNIAIQGIVSFLALFLLSAWAEGVDWIPSFFTHLKAILSILYLGLVSTAIAWLIYFRLIREWGVLKASAVTYTAPLVAIFVDWIYFGKWPAPIQVIGAGLIASGVALIHRARSK